MANPFGITEVTLNQLGDSTHAINTTVRRHPYQPLVAIATNHVDTTSNLGSDWPDGTTNASPENEAHLVNAVAVFVQKRHGEPWQKDANVINHLIHKAAATPAVPTNVSVLFPNFDYTTFE